jgi:cell division protein FtsB
MKLRPDIAPAPVARRPPFRRHLTLLVLALLVLAAASVMGNRGLVRLYRLQRERAEITREIDRLRGANAALAEEARILKSDPGGVEAIAREELGLVKPGEIVYEFRKPVPSASPRGR